MVQLLYRNSTAVRDTAVISLWNICALEQKAQQAFVMALGLKAVVNYLSQNTPTSAAGGEAAANILWSLAAKVRFPASTYHPLPPPPPLSVPVIHTKVYAQEVP